jgi:REP-associated tyrosine transposase
VRAGIVHTLAELNNYPYCGHRALTGEEKNPWQDVDYVLGHFGKTRNRALKGYCFYMDSGLDQGRQTELTGGGLIRSLGGWTELKKRALKGHEHIKSDERILGDSKFVDDVLSRADERFERKYELKRLGYDLGRVEARVAEFYKLKEGDILSTGKHQRKVKARSLFCYWAVRELGITLTEMARYLGLSVPGIGYSVERGEIIARENGYKLAE